MSREIKMGMTYKELLEAISSNGLNRTTTHTYNGTIMIRNLLPISTPHTAIFGDTANEDDVWLLRKTVIKKINSIKVGNTNVSEENFSLYPFFINIDNEETWKFTFSSSSIVGEDIEYSIDVECTFVIPLAEYRETTRQLADRVAYLEQSGGASFGVIDCVETAMAGTSMVSYNESYGVSWTDNGELLNDNGDTIGAFMIGKHAPIVAGDNVIFEVVDNKVVISATGGGGVTLDTISYVDTRYDGASDLEIGDFGITWYDRIAFVDYDGYEYVADTSYRLPIVAGDNVTFEVVGNKVVISATGGGSGDSTVSQIGGITIDGDNNEIAVDDCLILRNNMTLGYIELSDDGYTRIEGPNIQIEGTSVNLVGDVLINGLPLDTAIEAIAGPMVYEEVQMALGDELYTTVDQIVQQMGYCTSTDAWDIAWSAIGSSARLSLIEENISDLNGRVTTLEQGGSGGSGGSGGTKLYKITGSLMEMMTDNGITCKFQAVVSKDPTNISAFAEIFTSYGMVSITLMPDNSGFYPIGVTEDSNQNWKVYGIKNGSVLASENPFMMIGYETKEL